MAGLELAYVAWQLDRMASALDLINPYNYFGNFGQHLQSPEDFDSMTVDTYLRLNTKFKSVRDIIQASDTHSFYQKGPSITSPF